MSEIDAKTVMALRKATGAPMMQCKAALKATGGDMDKAKDELRKSGLKTADKTADREVEEGRVFSYVHHNGKLGVLAEVACETDFVARTEEFEQFGKTLCLTIAAYQPKFLVAEDIDESVMNKEREIVLAQTRESMAGKPEEIIEKAVEGRMGKFRAELCLVDKPWVLDDSRTVDQVRRELIAKIGENIQIRRFTVLELGA